MFKHIFFYIKFLPIIPLKLLFFFQLQNHDSCSKLNQRTVSPREINDVLTFQIVEKSVSRLKIQLDKLCQEHMGRISLKGEIATSRSILLFKSTKFASSVSNLSVLIQCIPISNQKYKCSVFSQLKGIIQDLALSFVLVENL